jgi:hypothetical protein
MANHDHENSKTGKYRSILRYWICAIVCSIEGPPTTSYITAKPPITTAANPTLPTPTTPTLPAAPVAATRDAEAEVEVDTLALSSFPSAAALAKVGTVLTHDLLILRLPVDTVDPVEEAGEEDEVEEMVEDKLYRGVVLVVLPEVEIEVGAIVLVVVWGVEVGVEVSDALQIVVDPWYLGVSSPVAIASVVDDVVAAALVIVDAIALADSSLEPSSSTSPLSSSSPSSATVAEVGIAVAIAALPPTPNPASPPTVALTPTPAVAYPPKKLAT